MVGVLIEGPHLGWTSSATLTGYACAAVAAGGFVWVESRRPEPLMDLRLFRRPVFSGAVVGAVAVFVALDTTLLLNTLYRSTPGSGRRRPQVWRPCRRRPERRSSPPGPAAWSPARDHGCRRSSPAASSRQAGSALAHASHPGWLVVAGCGAVLFFVAHLSRTGPVALEPVSARAR
ncbi:hypothetical protein [Streptomyces sp. NPDC086777]|uniref:hypothetical protein n=1 Tax=Streptomyces sp. NPDC086777 TaxID=3154866 RepID=UPI00344E77E2